MNNEPVAWVNSLTAMMEESFEVYKTKQVGFDMPLYTHPAKTQELLKEIQELKKKLMMEEESYILLDEELLCAKEAIKQQQVKIEVLKAKTLTDEEIVKIHNEIYGWDGMADIKDFARAILRKAQEK